MNLDIEPHYIKQCDHEICPQQYNITTQDWNNRDYDNLMKLLDQVLQERRKIQMNYENEKKPLKGALKFLSDDQEMQMIIFRSEEMEVINPCFFKNNEN